MPAFLNIAGGLDDGAGLHLRDFRKDDAQPAAAEAKHRVEFVQRLDALVNDLLGDAQFLGHFLLALVIVRQKLVQRRIEGADGHRVAVHRLEDAFEIFALERQQLGQRLLAIFLVGGQDHLAHRLDVVEKHMLRAAQADPFGAERDGLGSLIGLVGIGADLQLADGVGPFHELGILLIHARLFRLHRLVDQNLHDFARLGGDLAGHALRR